MFAHLGSEWGCLWPLVRGSFPLRATPPESAAGSGQDPLAVDPKSPVGLAGGPLTGPRRPSGWTSEALEALQVLGVDRPDRSDLEAIQPLLDQQAADVSLRSLEDGGGLGDGKRARAVDD
jgi:hypothetical protein